jgi:hypothetical protein
MTCPLVTREFGTVCHNNMADFYLIQDVDWLAWIQSVGTIVALAVSASAIYTAARDRRQLGRRIRHERLEDLAIAISHARTSIRQGSSDYTERDLAEVRARVSALPHGSHPKVWKLAETKFDAKNTAWSDDVKDRLIALTSEAENEIRNALSVSVGQLD